MQTKDTLNFDKMRKERARLEKVAAQKRREANRREMEEEKKKDGYEKTRIALEKLKMAWIKAKVTFTVLDFTAYKLYHSRVQERKAHLGHYITVRELGIFLNALAFVILVASTLQHKEKFTKLRLRYPEVSYSITLRLSYCILVFSFIVL